MLKYLILICFLLFNSPAFAQNLSCGINLEWFRNFDDERLFNYILDGLENNKDIITAQKNILIYRQERNKNIARLFPNINVGADYTLIKLPKTAIPSTDIQTNSFALPFLMAWEIDYLGARFNKIKQVKYDIQNACSDVIAANLTVAADVAGAYFNISNLDKQIELEKSLIETIKSVNLRKSKMFKFGTLSAIELNNSEKILVSELNNLEKLFKQREAFLTQLAYLMGKSPYTTDEIRVNPIDKIEYKGKYPDILKGDIILNRPDIIKLENEIKKAKIDITLAKKDFLPKINVFGAMVFSTIVQNFGWDGVFAGLAAGATQNLFDGGRRIFNLKQTKYEYEKAVENYLKCDLNALKEVNDSLYVLKKDIQIHQNYKKNYELENANFVRVFKSYETGAKSFIDYKESDIELIKREMALLNSKNQKFIDLLTLYKAVGGAL